MAERAVSPAATDSATLAQPDLEAWGRAVGRGAVAGSVPLPLVLALRGPLGAGKSVLARAIARAAGVTSAMPSPTYNLLFTYAADAGLRVHHLDLYRLEDPDDVWELGWQELGEGEQIVLIEWPERAESLLPPDRWDVRLDFVPARDPGSGEEAGGAPDPALRRIRIHRLGAAPSLPALGDSLPRDVES